MERYLNFIGGRPLANQTGETFAVTNPATNEPAYTVESADAFILNQAIETAQAGFQQWSAMTGIERSRILQRAVNLLRERNDELARIEVIDTGKPIQEASVVDIASGADAIEFFAGLAPMLEGNQQSLGEDFYYTRREPLGICAGIGAWNYPLQIACWKAGPALACGNAMIFKPSEETPLGALKLAEIFKEACVPDGLFNVVLGNGSVGQALSEHPAIAKVSFTGSVATGQSVMAECRRACFE